MNTERLRVYPTWEPVSQQDEDAIVSAIVDIFWESTAEVVGLLMDWTLQVAKHAGLNIKSLALKGWPWPPQPGSEHDPSSLSYGKSPVAFSLSEEEKALKHIACCLFQTIGLFDTSIALEHRSDTLDTGFVLLDQLLAIDGARFLTRDVLQWGNAHGVVVYGPLCIETGIKTDQQTVAGILITSRFNPRNKRPALRLVPADSNRRAFRLDVADLMHIPPGSVCRIAPHTPFASVKEAIDGTFLQINHTDPYSDAILDTFLLRTLQYEKSSSSRKLTMRESVKALGIKDVVGTIRNYQETGAYDKLVRNRISAFMQLLVNQPDIAKWNSITRNCQHFCSAILASRCFLREDGYDRVFGPSRTPSKEHAANSTVIHQSSLPSVRKVFQLVDDQDPKLSPWFKEYFSSVQRSKGDDMMISFRDAEINKTLLDMPSRRSLLDLRRFGIPMLPDTVEYSQASGRLGIPPEESADAWFALSAISLYFLWPEDLPNAKTLVGMLSKGGMSLPVAFGILALGYFEWLEKAAHPRLMNSIAFAALTSLTSQEREAVHDIKQFAQMLDGVERKIQAALREREKAKRAKEKQKLDEEIRKARERRELLKACWEFEVKLPQLRALKRGPFEWLSKLG